MKRITLIRQDDDMIQVISDEDQNGSLSFFKEITDEQEQFMIALAEFFGFEPSEFLNL